MTMQTMSGDVNACEKLNKYQNANLLIWMQAYENNMLIYD